MACLRIASGRFGQEEGDVTRSRQTAACWCQATHEAGDCHTQKAL